MENNIFYINKKDKYNPDINNKFLQKENERLNNNYNLSNVIYNPITGIIPTEIKSPEDLKINNDNTIYNINKLISEKENERKQQEQLFKNNDNINNIQTKVINNYNQNNYNDSFNELKEKSLINNKCLDNNNNFNNILIELKDLGILN
jgi:hypothetical protein